MGCLGGKFDMHYVYKLLYKEMLLPSMLRRGCKLYEMRVPARKDKNPGLIFRDSFNLLNMPLGQLVPSFALSVKEKPFFPYKVVVHFFHVFICFNNLYVGQSSWELWGADVKIAAKGGLPLQWIYACQTNAV
jgi:hypothetical protein